MKARTLKVFILVLLIAGALAGVKIVGLEKIYSLLHVFEQYVQGLGWWGFFIYALVFAACSLVGAPVSPLTLGSGLIFGFLGGTGACLLGASLGCALGFLISRYLAREMITQKLVHSPKFKAIDSAIGSEGWKIVILLRLCPLPFGLSNYLYGMTSIPFLPYLWASVIGILPSIAFYVYLGVAGKAGLDSAASKSTSSFLPIAVGVVVGLICLIYVGRLARKAVARAAADTPLPSPQMVEIPEEK